MLGCQRFVNRIGSHLDEFKNEFQSDSLFKFLLSSMALAGIREEVKLNETGRIRWSTDLCCQLLFGRMRRVQAGCLCSMRFGPSRIHASATERTCRHSEWRQLFWSNLSKPGGDWCWIVWCRVVLDNNWMFFAKYRSPLSARLYYICSPWFCQCRCSVFYFLGGSCADGIWDVWRVL